MIRRLFIFAGCAALSAMAADAKFDAAVATNQLGLDLYRQLARKNPSGNLVISPYSIESALALAYSGADGATRTEMANALHFPEDDASLQTSFGALRVALDEIARASTAELAENRRFGGNGDTIECQQANGLFGQEGYVFRPSFLDLMKEGYDASFQPLNFKTNAETARESINAWVAKQTHQKIRNLVPSGSLDDRTRLVLVNALYLKAPWWEPFEKSATRSRVFRVNATVAPKVPTMTLTKIFGYEKAMGFTMVALDYSGSELRFLILLPDEDVSCDNVAAQLTPELLKEWAAPRRGPHAALIELYLPKFTAEGPTLPLGTALRALGIKRAFDEPQGSADFGRMALRLPDDYLRLSELFHKTFIAVDEKGTEAAAATFAPMLLTLGVEASPPKPIVVRVDRPFLFAIQHRASGACLFLGRITDPR